MFSVSFLAPKPVKSASWTDSPALTPTTRPSDVMSRVHDLSHYLTLIRQELNSPEPSSFGLTVTFAQPRQVYFIALALFRRTNRLAFEKTRTLVEEPTQDSAHQITPHDVLGLVELSLQNLQVVGNSLKLSYQDEVRTYPHSTTPSDVFVEILKINRQVDLILEEAVSPADVYQQVTLGVHYAIKLLTPYPTAQRIPHQPSIATNKTPIPNNKTPTDVWKKLEHSFALLGKISQQSGQTFLFFDTTEFNYDKVTPGDVYLLASTIVAELAYIHSKDEQLRPVIPSYSPGPKLPTEVYQRVQMLDQQLQQLLRLYTANSSEALPSSSVVSSSISPPL